MPARTASSHRTVSAVRFDDPIETTATRPILRVLCAALAGIITLLMLALIVVVPAMWMRWLGLIVAFDLSCAAAFVLTTRGRLHSAPRPARRPRPRLY